MKISYLRLNMIRIPCPTFALVLMACLCQAADSSVDAKAAPKTISERPAKNLQIRAFSTIEKIRRKHGKFTYREKFYLTNDGNETLHVLAWSFKHRATAADGKIDLKSSGTGSDGGCEPNPGIVFAPRAIFLSATVEWDFLPDMTESAGSGSIWNKATDGPENITVDAVTRYMMND